MALQLLVLALVSVCAHAQPVDVPTVLPLNEVADCANPLAVTHRARDGAVLVTCFNSEASNGGSVIRIRGATVSTLASREQVRVCSRIARAPPCELAPS